MFINTFLTIGNPSPSSQCSCLAHIKKMPYEGIFSSVLFVLTQGKTPHKLLL